MIPKPLKEISLEDIKMLKENKIPEGKTIDYKENLSVETDDEKREFYKDITAFTNAEGGDLIYGVEEEDRLPKRIVGIEVADIDQTLSKLHNMIRSGIEPTIIPEPEINGNIKLEKNKYVIIIRVHNSFLAPHRISFNKNNKFWIRGDGDSFEMSITELRNAFVFSQNIAERIQKFRLERLHKLISSDTPVPLTTRLKGKMMLHVIPAQSIIENKIIDVNSDEVNRILESNKFVPIADHGSFSLYNIEGFLKHEGFDSKRGTYSYVQFFRNGVIEAVMCGCVQGEEHAFYLGIEKNLVNEYLLKYLELLKSLNILPPIYVFLTFYDVKGSRFNKSSIYNPVYTEDNTFDKDLISLLEVIINEFISSGTELENILKPIFDMLMNAFGHKAQ